MAGSTVSLDSLSSPSPSPPPEPDAAQTLSQQSTGRGTGAGLDSGSDLSDLTEDEHDEDLQASFDTQRVAPTTYSSQKTLNQSKSKSKRKNDSAVARDSQLGDADGEPDDDEPEEGEVFEDDGEGEGEAAESGSPFNRRSAFRNRAEMAALKKRGGMVPAPMWDWAYKAKKSEDRISTTSNPPAHASSSRRPASGSVGHSKANASSTHVKPTIHGNHAKPSLNHSRATGTNAEEEEEEEEETTGPPEAMEEEEDEDAGDEDEDENNSLSNSDDDGNSEIEEEESGSEDGELVEGPSHKKSDSRSMSRRQGSQKSRNRKPPWRDVVQKIARPRYPDPPSLGDSETDEDEASDIEEESDALEDGDEKEHGSATRRARRKGDEIEEEDENETQSGDDEEGDGEDELPDNADEIAPVDEDAEMDVDDNDTQDGPSLVSAKATAVVSSSQLGGSSTSPLQALAAVSSMQALATAASAVSSLIHSSSSLAANSSLNALASTSTALANSSADHPSVSAMEMAAALQTDEDELGHDHLLSAEEKDKPKVKTKDDRLRVDTGVAQADSDIGSPDAASGAALTGAPDSNVNTPSKPVGIDDDFDPSEKMSAAHSAVATHATKRGGKRGARNRNRKRKRAPVASAANDADGESVLVTQKTASGEQDADGVPLDDIDPDADVAADIDHVQDVDPYATPARDLDNSNDLDPSRDPDADLELELESDLQPAHRAEALDVLATIELKFALLRERVYVEKMEDLAWEEWLVGEGTHPELIHLQAELAKRRDKRLDLATKRQAHEMAIATQKRKADEDAIWSWWRFARDELQTDMISEANRKRRKVERERKLSERPQLVRRIPNPPQEVAVAPTLRQIAKSVPFYGGNSYYSSKRPALSATPSSSLAYPGLSILMSADIDNDLEYLFRHRRFAQIDLHRMQGAHLNDGINSVPNINMNAGGQHIGGPVNMSFNSFNANGGVPIDGMVGPYGALGGSRMASSSLQSMFQHTQSGGQGYSPFPSGPGEGHSGRPPSQRYQSPGLHGGSGASQSFLERERETAQGAVGPGVPYPASSSSQPFPGPGLAMGPASGSASGHNYSSNSVHLGITRPISPVHIVNNGPSSMAGGISGPGISGGGKHNLGAWGSGGRGTGMQPESKAFGGGVGSGEWAEDRRRVDEGEMMVRDKEREREREKFREREHEQFESERERDRAHGAHSAIQEGSSGHPLHRHSSLHPISQLMQGTGQAPHHHRQHFHHARPHHHHILHHHHPTQQLPAGNSPAQAPDGPDPSLSSNNIRSAATSRELGSAVGPFQSGPFRSATTEIGTLPPSSPEYRETHFKHSSRPSSTRPPFDDRDRPLATPLRLGPSQSITLVASTSAPASLSASGGPSALSPRQSRSGADDGASRISSSTSSGLQVPFESFDSPGPRRYSQSNHSMRPSQSASLPRQDSGGAAGVSPPLARKHPSSPSSMALPASLRSPTQYPPPLSSLGSPSTDGQVGHPVNAAPTTASPTLKARRPSPKLGPSQLHPSQLQGPGQSAAVEIPNVGSAPTALDSRTSPSLSYSPQSHVVQAAPRSGSGPIMLHSKVNAVPVVDGS